MLALPFKAGGARNPDQEELKDKAGWVGVLLTARAEVTCGARRRREQPVLQTLIQIQAKPGQFPEH